MLLQAWGTHSFDPIVFQGMAILQDLFTVAQLLLLGRKACRYMVLWRAGQNELLKVLTLRYRLLSPVFRIFRIATRHVISNWAHPASKATIFKTLLCFLLFWPLRNAQSLNNSHDMSEMSPNMSFQIIRTKTWDGNVSG